MPPTRPVPWPPTSRSRPTSDRSRPPLRTCIGCRRVAPAGELVRCAATDDGRLVISRTAPGRGAWLCPSVDCIDAAARRRSFERALRRSISTDAVSELRIAFEALLGNMRELPAADPGSAAVRTKKG